MFRDWGHDILALPVGWWPRHLGFTLAWKKIRAAVRVWAREHSTSGGLVVTGHSLGGALALLAANELVKNPGPALEAVITFGSPRVGTWPWTGAYHRRKIGRDHEHGPLTLRDITWRIRNPGDIVTYLPFLLFSHCGKLIDLQSTPGPMPRSPFLPDPAGSSLGWAVGKAPTGPRAPTSLTIRWLCSSTR